MAIERNLVIYVAGPMTGRPQFNVPAFHRQATRLRGAGYTVVSPTELDDPAFQAWLMSCKTGRETYPSGETWGDFLARDVKVIADRIDAICVLPEWEKSRGAKLEVFVGLLSGKPILMDKNYAESTDQVALIELDRTDVIFTIARSLVI